MFWITAVLRSLFSLPYAEHLSFKGGTSLSKCWNAIERFSEDVDIAVNREFLGFSGTLSKTQISDRLRRASCSFVREKLQFDLAAQLEKDGINTDVFSVNVEITPISTTDPEKIFVEYKSLFKENPYIKPSVILEISGRSMNEPLKNIKIQSFLDEEFAEKSFAEKPFSVQAVVAERTFLEKICLLHEEFAKPAGTLRIERMSRHLYDLERMIDMPISENALKNKELYKSIVEHKKTFIGLKNFDYNTLALDKISIIPPENVIAQWNADYRKMQETMIYGDSLPFGKLIEKIKQLNERLRNISL
ncbi:MAG: nucleotidyl transferase AbiEii/AbiGii toxin family protein [Prevotellaceae bacterium]|nr:nucleotidyl transferase AbiEii/AbiGii toxin family protein [Prevotellaceae bacterium]